MAKQVTVVMLTYNPNLEKLKNTLNSIAMQKDIDFELIIADDGSKKIDTKKIEECSIRLFPQRKVKFIWNECNRGTVRNYLSAVREAEGRYIYGISPGDYFYDEYVLRDLYEFAEQNNVDVCFGKPQCYVNDTTGQRLVRNISPQNPEFFLPSKYNKIFSKTAFFFGQFAIGATYFRKRDFLLKTLEKIAEKIIYVEDEVTSFIYLLDGGKLLYCDRFVVFYESDSGISTNKNHPLSKKFKDDEKAIERYIRQYYQNDSVVQFKYIDSHFLRVIHHPYIAVCVCRNKLCKMISKVREQQFGDEENLKKIQNYQINLKR